MGGEIDRYVQTDGVMYPGFSGGPLMDAAGNVLGISTSGLLRGYSLAVPAPTVARVAESLAAHGRVRRGYLGLTAQVVRLPEAVVTELGQDTGLMVMSVESGGPADSGGLAMGDTIVALESVPVRDLDDLLGGLSGDRVGRAVAVRVLRGGRPTDLTVTVGERS
jgi:S1-C subfamily serine protease